MHLLLQSRVQVFFYALIISAVAVVAVPSVSYAEIKIGYIDMQKAIQETKAGKQAKSSLKKEFEKRKKVLQKKEADLKKMNTDLEKKAMVLSDDVRLKKQQELQREMLMYREMVGKSQLEFQKKELELTKPIIQKLQKIIGNMAKKDGYTVILEKSEQSVLWAKKEIDLTDKVVKVFNK